MPMAGSRRTDCLRFRRSPSSSPETAPRTGPGAFVNLPLL
jgi:hypothetical protein